MNRLMLNLIILALATGACQTKLTKIPTGTWKYKLLVNGANIGKAVVTNEIASNNYVSTMDMEMNAGYVRNSTRQVITETLDFKPVKLEVYNKTIQNDQASEIKTIAKFKGDRVDLDTGDSKSIIKIEKPFVLEGNFFMQELIKADLKPGTVIKNYVYEPSVDIETPILMIVKVLGREKVSIDGKVKNLLHLGCSVENLKNIDMYVDDAGVTQKTVIVLLNNKLEMILE
jgi:hypothetical protein